METANNNLGIATLAELRDQWHQLRDIDRALAVHKLHKAGTSLRALAKALGRSESLLRNLNLAAQAPVADRILARQGKISTRKLVRRAKQAQALCASTE